MPLYELECTKCGKKEEKLFTTYVNFISKSEMRKRKKIKSKEDEDAYIEKQYKILGFRIKERRPAPTHHPKCGFCGGEQNLLPSKVAMQPDKYWSGQVVHGKYVTSKKEIDRDIEPATREKMEYVQKRKEKRIREHNEKASNNLKEYLTKQLADVTIEPDGSTVGQKRKYERKRTTSE